MNDYKFDYGCDAYISLIKESKHYTPFNNKIGKIISEELTKEYRLNNHPKAGMYVLLFEHSMFNEEEKKYLKDKDCPEYKNENGVMCYTSSWIFNKEEMLEPNKYLILKSKLMQLAKTN